MLFYWYWTNPLLILYCLTFKTNLVEELDCIFTLLLLNCEILYNQLFSLLI